MTIEETTKILSLIYSEYPNSFNKLSKSDLNAKATLWTRLLSDIDYKTAGKALQMYLVTDTTGYPPTVGKLRQNAVRLTQKPILDSTSAWQAVKRAIHAAEDNPYQAFQALPEECKRIVGDYNQLMDWTCCTAERINTVVYSNFIKSYTAMQNETTEFLTLPPELKAIARKTPELPPTENMRAIETKFMERYQED